MGFCSGLPNRFDAIAAYFEELSFENRDCFGIGVCKFDRRHLEEELSRAFLIGVYSLLICVNSSEAAQLPSWIGGTKILPSLQALCKPALTQIGLVSKMNLRATNPRELEERIFQVTEELKKHTEIRNRRELGKVQSLVADLEAAFEELLTQTGLVYEKRKIQKSGELYTLNLRFTDRHLGDLNKEKIETTEYILDPARSKKINEVKHSSPLLRHLLQLGQKLREFGGRTEAYAPIHVFAVPYLDKDRAFALCHNFGEGGGDSKRDRQDGIIFSTLSFANELISPEPAIFVHEMAHMQSAFDLLRLGNLARLSYIDHGKRLDRSYDEMNAEHAEEIYRRKVRSSGINTSTMSTGFNMTDEQINKDGDRLRSELVSAERRIVLAISGLKDLRDVIAKDRQTHVRDFLENEKLVLGDFTFRFLLEPESSPRMDSIAIKWSGDYPSTSGKGSNLTQLGVFLDLAKDARHINTKSELLKLLDYILEDFAKARERIQTISNEQKLLR
jgi:hypothetical protein